MMHRKQQEHETGEDFEQQLLFPSEDPRLRKIKSMNFLNIPSMSYIEAMRALLSIDPTNNGIRYSADEQVDPPTRWANDVHEFLREKIGCEDMRHLRFYPALKTPADLHGIDLLIEYADQKTQQKYYATVDFTTNPEKKAHKADVIVTETGVFAHPDAFPEVASIEIVGTDRGAALERREAVAEVLARVLQQKMRDGQPGIDRASLAGWPGGSRMSAYVGPVA